MKRLTALVGGLAAVCIPLTPLTLVPAATGQPAAQARQEVLIEPTVGVDVYTHAGPTDYRIGPDLVREPGNPLRELTCGPGTGGSAEVIRSSAARDVAGRLLAFPQEQVVLQPTPGSADAGGVCDPSVVKVGATYYLAYTGTSPTGRRQVFVARSTSLDGPYAKWNGAGWASGAPAPIAPVDASGPSLVVMDDELYLYYGMYFPGDSYQTRLATFAIGATPAAQETWPARRTAPPRPVIEHPERYAGRDCVGNHYWTDTDVKYDENTGRFIALTTDQAYPWTVLQAYESTDGGRTFTQAIVTRGTYHRGARTPGILADVSGHVPAGLGFAFAYAYSSGCGSADLYYSQSRTSLVDTGSVVEPFDAGPGTLPDWHPDSGSWSLQPGGYYRQSSTDDAVSESTLLGRAAGGSSSVSVLLTPEVPPTRDWLGWPTRSWIGVHFDKVHPADTVGESGYTAYLESGVGLSTGKAFQVRLCISKAGFGILQCRDQDLQHFTYPAMYQLQIVQSEGNIKVYLDGDSAAGLFVTDADDPYVGGYVGLSTYGSSGNFENLRIGDNVPAPSTADDWSVQAGAWRFGSTVTDRSSQGQLNLVTSWGKDVSTQLGNGTYAATISIAAGAAPTGWAGLALTNHGLTGSWSSGGYLVFLRADGDLGIYKAGTGQVVADAATGRDPVRKPVRIRVIKSGANLQVYVDDVAAPTINWTDTSSSAWAIGGFGLANLDALATFSGVTFDADQAR